MWAMQPSRPGLLLGSPIFWGWKIYLPETNIAPENGWLEYDCFLLRWPIFRCENVSFRECRANKLKSWDGYIKKSIEHWKFGMISG